MAKMIINHGILRVLYFFDHAFWSPESSNLICTPKNEEKSRMSKAKSVGGPTVQQHKAIPISIHEASDLHRVDSLPAANHCFFVPLSLRRSAHRAARSLFGHRKKTTSFVPCAETQIT
jgi:hypothetical protein